MKKEREIFMTLLNEFSGCVFVKTYEFFKEQGGFREKWGEAWVPVVATEIEHARAIRSKDPKAKPYRGQAGSDPKYFDL
jgi:hypothetical protein